MPRPLLSLTLLLALAPPLSAQGVFEPTPEEVAARARRRTPVVEVFESSRDAVVNISSTQIVTVRGRSPFDGFLNDMFDFPIGGPSRQVERTSVGSGFVIHPDGYIVTNAHVVARTAERKATFADGREYAADLVAIDEQRDLAMLKVEAAEPLPLLPLGRSDDLMIGETVIAIGNPLGYTHTVTAGVVSAVDRDLMFTPEHGLRGLVQTDASINPGNSGGPLLNALGELIGVNTAIRGDAQNIGFAIPVDQLRELLPEMLDVERRYRLDVGVEITPGRPVLVKRVREGSAAARAGLRPGDRIVAVDGRRVPRALDWHIALLGRRAGDVLGLEVERRDEPVRVELEIGDRPLPDGAALALARLGMELRPLAPEAGRRLQIRPGTGLEIVAVELGSPASRADVQPGAAIVAVGRVGELTIEDLGLMLEHVERGDRVPLTLRWLDRRGIIQRRLVLEARSDAR